MDECNAALVLMSLGCSPVCKDENHPQDCRGRHFSLPPGVGFGVNGTTNMNEIQLGSSPTGSSHSSNSCTSGTSSPGPSDDGNGMPMYPRFHRGPRTTSLSDEGIVLMDDDLPRKRRVSSLLYIFSLFFVRLAQNLNLQFTLL